MDNERCVLEICVTRNPRFHVYSRDVVAICLIKEASGNHSPFRERPVRGRGGGGGGADGRREGEEDVLREEERVGIAEDGVLSSTREAALRRAQVTEEEWELRERRHHVVADALTKSVPGIGG